MESEQIVKKTRKPRVKKEFAEEIKSEEQPPKRNITKRLNKKKPAEEEKKEEQPKKEDFKGAVILGIDPAFKKCGFGLISVEKGEYIHSFQ